MAFSQFASEDPTGFLLPGSLPAVSLFGYEPLSLLPDPRLAPIASAPPYAPDWSGFRPAQPPAKRQKLTLPRTPATPQSKPPKVKAPKPPKAPKAPKIVVRPEFTISKTDWVTPSALPMLAVEPPIVLRADPVGERPPKNPHRERVGIEIVEEKRKGDLDLILRTVAGPVRAPPKSKKGKEKALEPTEGVESKQDTFTLVHALPPIWCMVSTFTLGSWEPLLNPGGLQGRQELCEALPYYHSYQGGHYDKGEGVSCRFKLRSLRPVASPDERCIGYLLDGFPSPKDCCADGGWVIISHVSNFPFLRLHHHFLNTCVGRRLLGRQQGGGLPPHVEPGARQPPRARPHQLPQNALPRGSHRGVELRLLPVACHSQDPIVSSPPFDPVVAPADVPSAPQRRFGLLLC